MIPCRVFRTTKMCTTNLSGVGDCVDLSRDGDFCDDRDEMKGDGAACQLFNFDPEVQPEKFTHQIERCL